MKKWDVLGKYQMLNDKCQTADIIKILLQNRGIKTKRKIEQFLYPLEPNKFTPQNVGINTTSLKDAILRLQKAIQRQESIVVYADYDADGITAAAVIWQALNTLGAKVMPYIPHRTQEGYGLSEKGINAVKEQYNSSLIITVDHGITAADKIKYAEKLGIEVIVTDHHVKPKKLPDCIIVHTLQLSGAGVAWFIIKELLKKKFKTQSSIANTDLLTLAAIGTIADMVPLVGANRSIVKHGLAVLNSTKNIGLTALINEAGLICGKIGTYEISHILAPRLNAVGRLIHAMDALRLLCTQQKDKAEILARKLGLTNRERQQLTLETTKHALQGLSLRQRQSLIKQKIIFVSHETYNQGVIGLVAGKLVEEYYRPTIVVSKGELVSKASARSITGFNIIEAIRSCSDILVDAGGHPMAAGFTIETKYLNLLEDRLGRLAEKELDEEKLTRRLRIDLEIPLELATLKLWKELQSLLPFGFGNSEPVFVSRGVMVIECRLVGVEGRHLKLKLALNNKILKQSNNDHVEAIAFGMGEWFGKLKPQETKIDLAYLLDLNTWDGHQSLQLKIKDLQLTFS